MKRFSIVFILLTSIVILNAVAVFQENFTNRDATNISFSLPTYQLENVDIKGKTFTKIKLPDLEEYSDSQKPGTPDLPQFSQYLLIPENSRLNYEINIIESEVVNNVNIVPSRNLEDIKNGNSSYKYEVNTYMSRATTDVVEIFSPEIARDKIINRIVLNPFIYDISTKKLTIIKKADITFTFEQSRDDKKPALNIASRSYDEMLKQLIINKSALDNRTTEYQRSSYLIIYPQINTIDYYIEDFAKWKREMGYYVQTVSTEETGPTADDIKNYIEQLYETSEYPPEFILLLGDAFGTYSVPTVYETLAPYTDTYGDHPYTTLDGDDDFSDAFVGRLSFESPIQLLTMFKKIYKYEKMDFEDTGIDFLNNVLLLGDHTNSGISTVLTMEQIRRVMNLYQLGLNINLVDNYPYINQMNDAFTNGIGAFFYRGFGDFSGWTNQDTNSLTNIGKTPFSSMITCFTGNFADYNMVSHVEAFTRAGTPNNLIGANSAIGSTTATHTCFNNLITSAIADGIYQHQFECLGEAHNFAKIALYENYPHNPNLYVDWYTLGKVLMGDPGMKLITKSPEQLIANYPEEINSDQDNIFITVKDTNNNPINNATISIYKHGEELSYLALTNDNGEALIPINVENYNDSLSIVIYKRNYKTHINTINVVNNIDYISPSEIVFSENPVAGNIVNYSLKLQNFSNNPISGNISISTENEHITLNDTQLEFSNVPANGFIMTDNISLSISPNAQNNEEVLMKFIISYSDISLTKYLSFNIMAPEIELVNILQTGNFEPGTTIPIGFSLKNTGLADAENVTLTLNYPESLCSLTSNVFNFGNIEVNLTSEIDDAFITLSDELNPGQIFTINGLITADNNFQQELPIDIVVFSNEDWSAYTGPDEYGYYIIDDDDESNSMIDAPIYNWVEIDPNYGGNGVSLELYDVSSNGSGDSKVITLPFIFRFYGKAYNQITVCSNGYLVPGNHSYQEWMNRHIPSANLPKPLIAPFWDDLLTSNNGNVYYYYDEDLSAMIIEWSRMLNRFDGQSEETFQAILYDASENPTHSGDSKIKFQYNTINNVDEGSYDGFYVHHGEYATVGIADESSTMGVEYTFSADYPTSAKILQNNMALLIDTNYSNISRPYILLNSLNFEEIEGNMNNIIDYNEQHNLQIELSNYGKLKAENISAVITIESEYASISNNVFTIENLEPGESSTPENTATITMADDCPNNTLIPVVLNLEYNGESYSEELGFYVTAPQVIASNFTFVGDEVNFGNDSSGAFEITLHKNSYFPINNLEAILTCDNDEITISPSSLNISNFQDGMTISFDVTSSQNIVNGTYVTFTLSLIHDLSEEYSFDYYIGHPTIIFEEDFESGNTNNWDYPFFLISDNLFAGGEGHEAHMYNDNYQTSFMITNFLNIGNAQKIILEFDYRCFGGNKKYGFGFLPNSNHNYESNINMDEPEHMTFEYYVNGINTDAFSLFFFKESMSGNQTFAIDNIKVMAIGSSPAIIYGHINSDDENIDYSQGVVRFNNTAYPIDENGNYYIETQLGDYTMSVEMDHYYNEPIEISIPESAVYEQDLFVHKLDVPENLEYTIDGNMVTLTWDEVEDEYLSLNFYKINLIYGNSSTTSVITTDNIHTRYLPATQNYTFYVEAYYEDGYVSAPSDSVSFYFVDNEEDVQVPTKLFLNQNYPNPFNPTTTIEFGLPNDVDNCNITIFDIRGRKVKTLINNNMKKGYHSVIWNGDDNVWDKVSSGVYFYKLSIDGKSKAINKCILLK